MPPRGAGNSLVDFRIKFLTASICVLKKVLLGVCIPSLLSAHRRCVLEKVSVGVSIPSPLSAIHLFRIEIIIELAASNEISSVELEIVRDPNPPPSSQKKRKFSKFFVCWTL